MRHVEINSAPPLERRSTNFLPRPPRMHPPPPSSGPTKTTRPYASFVNWDFFPSKDLPILVYFKEVLRYNRYKQRKRRIYMYIYIYIKRQIATRHASERTLLTIRFDPSRKHCTDGDARGQVERRPGRFRQLGRGARKRRGQGPGRRFASRFSRPGDSVSLFPCFASR